MIRTSMVRLRVTAVALIASACLLGGAASAQAATATATVTATETAKFTGSGTGGTMGSAIESATNVALSYAQAAGWQRSQCYRLASDVRQSGGWFTAVSQVFCQR
ncbi:hypothetical protein OG401_35480 [Kitasatospora purpeofusca]|uniref:hypothetical protein n=1 Tax=Kitasatospora purpeofusca TaxID=67352 RepID=UPI000A5FC239|nr:hypothetical protein [Kitasatospora purpeofusca]MCX4689538.1 hypothetical protein [Kitasatospora purpeofusca]